MALVEKNSIIAADAALADIDAKLKIEAIELDCAEKLQALRDTIAALESKLNETSASLAECAEIIKLLEDTKQQLEHQVVEISKSHIESENREASIAVLAEEKSALSITLDEASLKIATLEDDYRQLEDIVVSLEKENLAYEERVYSAEKTAAEAEQLREQVQAAEKQIEDMIEDISIFKVKNQELEIANSALSKQVERTALTITEMKTELACQYDVAYIQSMHEKATVQIASLQKQLCESSEALNSSNSTAEMLRLQLQQAQTLYQQQIIQLQGSVSSNSSHASLSAAFISGDAALAKKEAERVVEGLTSELGAKDAEISRLMKLSVELGERASRSEQIISTSMSRESAACDGEEAMRKRIGQLQTTVDLLKSERDVLIHRLQATEAEVKDIRSQASISEGKLQSEIISLSVQLDKHLSDSGNSTRMLDSIKALEVKMAELKQERDDATQSLTNCTVDLQKAQEKLNSLIGADGNSAASDTISFLKSQMLAQAQKEECLHTQIEEITRDVKEAQNRLKQAKEQSMAVQAEWERCDETLRKSIEECHELQHELELSRSEVKQLHETIQVIQSNAQSSDIPSQLEDEIRELKELLEASEMRNTLFEGDQNSLRVEMNELHSRTVRAEQNASELNEILVSTKSHRDGLETSVASLTAQVGAMKDKITSLRAERDIALSKVESSVTLSTTGSMSESERVALLAELNSLMEQKMDVESRLTEAESQTKEYRKRLSEYDQASAREQEEIMKAAESEMDSLRSQHEELQSRLKAEIADRDLKISSLTQLVESSRHTNECMLSEKSNLLATELQNKIVELEATNEALAASMAKSERLQKEKTEWIERLRESQSELANATELNASLEDKLLTVRQEHEELIAVKEKRIVHLEQSKLTKDQMEKIQQCKDERKKYHDECKVLKKQLQQLKKVYDDLAASAKSSASGATSASSAQQVAEVQVKLDEISNKYEHVTAITKTLKEKIHECSRQIKDYEEERSAIIEVLEKSGIDTAAYSSPPDSSLLDDSTLSNADTEPDLSHAVALLADKVQKYFDFVTSII